MIERLTCILCPVGCELEVDRAGDDLEVRGNQCDKGIGFADEEILHPKRNLATSVPLRGTASQMVSVRLTPGSNVRYCLPQAVRLGTSGFELSFRVIAPVREAWIDVRSLASGKPHFRKKFPRLVPSELQKITVASPAVEDMEVSCHD